MRLIDTVTTALESSRRHRPSGVLRLAAVVAVCGIGVSGACKRQEDAPPSKQTPTAPSKPTIDTSNLDRVVGKKGMNVLYVSVDTTRADHLGCYGHPTVKTPNVDRFASEGVRFAWCISSAPLTLVSHSTMMTGSYQFVHGARDNGMFSLSDDNVTLAEIFLEEGYSTAAEVASIVLDPKYGMNQGFEWYGEVTPQNAGVVIPLGPQKPGEEPEVPAMSAPEVDLDRKANDITNRGIALLQECVAKDKPFFIFLHYYDPHWPHEAPEEFANQYDDPYFAEIAYWDSEFGRLLDELDRLKLAENTLVVLVSDHGEGRGQHGEYTHACFLYDTTLHVPCMLRCKGTIPEGVVVESQVRLVDMAPTVLEFVGLESRFTPQMQGVSLLPLIANPELDFNLQCYADTITPAMMYHYAPLRALRAEGWKYILAPKPELYRVSTDTLELFNLSQTEADRSFQMRQMLWDLIEDSPPPPGGQRGGVIEADADALTQLRALGYVSSVEEMGAFTSGRELDHFEPVGENPRDHTEEIEIFASALGALRMGRYELAETQFKRFLEGNPNHAVAQSSLATCYIGQERWDDAATAYRRSIELQPEAHEEYRRLGLVLGRLNRLEEAEQVFRGGIAIEGHDHKLHIHLAGLLTYLRRVDEAMEQLQEAVKLSPEEPTVHYALGVGYARQRETEKAISCMRRVIELDPKFVHARAAIIMALRVAGRIDEAIKVADEEIKSQPKEALLYYEKALCFVERGSIEDAGKLFEQIVEIAPEVADARVWLATNLANRGKQDEAIEQLKKATELDPNQQLLRMRLMAALKEQGRIDEALTVCLEVVEKWPELCEAPRAAAHLCDQLTRPGQAIEVLTKALEKCDGDPRILNDLAWRLATAPDSSLRDGARAVELARKASALASDDNPYYLDTLAAAYAEMGDFEKAVSISDRAMNVAHEVGDKNVSEEISSRRELYGKNKPYHEQ